MGQFCMFQDIQLFEIATFDLGHPVHVMPETRGLGVNLHILATA